MCNWAAADQHFCGGDDCGRPAQPLAAAAAVGSGRHVGSADLVFQDTILSFVAGVQLGSNDMLRVGDWIEMPQVGADGFVTDTLR